MLSLTGKHLESIATFLVVIPLMTASAACVCAQPPEWRGEPGTDWLGDDVLWRSREGLVFHMQDPAGGGFDVSVAVRDMNIYEQGRRPALIWMVGPQGQTLFRRVLEDDGVTSGNEQYREGVSDVYLDYRYREWHRIHSPDGRPPNKKRSPVLSEPESLPARDVSFTVEDAGPGLYRLVLIGSWDHWFAVTPDRAIPTGLHPGPGPLHVHGDRLEDAWVWAPPGAEEIMLSLSEEVQPFNWQAVLEDEDGNELGTAASDTFMSYLHRELPEGDAVYRLSVTGETPGACLSLAGLPFVVCPDAETARAIHGGMGIDQEGRATFHHQQRVLLEWADGLTEDDLRVDVAEVDLTAVEEDLRKLLAAVPEALEQQQIDPAAEDFGRANVSVLAEAAGTEHPQNPYYANAALTRRVALAAAVGPMQNLGPYFWFARTDLELPGTFDVRKDRLPMFRSNWFAMHSGRHVTNLADVVDVAGKALPPEVLAAWEREYEAWVEGRTLMHQGICSNQWMAALSEVAEAAEALDSPVAHEVVDRQIERFTTIGGLGRVGPDPTPCATKSETAFTYAADTGYVGAGYAADGLGHDNQYCLETTSHLGRIWQRTGKQSIVDFIDHYYFLKTHLTMPRGPEAPESTFADTCSPSDANFRTGYFTHKSPVPSEMRPMVGYGLLWAGDTSAGETWPCLEEGSFTRVLDNKFFFIKTPTYYATAYGGPSNYDWQNFTTAEVGDGSASLVGYSGMHYGGLQRKAAKPGGISAVYVAGCGPTMLAQNHNVMYSNVVWGRRPTPVTEKWEQDHVDPRIVCSGFSQPSVSFDRDGRVYRRTDELLYAPLTVTRTVTYRDDRIVVDLELRATDDLELTELYECVPLYVEDREASVFEDLSSAGVEFAMPEAVTSHDSHDLPLPHERGENPDLPRVAVRAFDVTSESGAGSAVIFDDQYECMQTQPLRYRSAAAATGALNLPLPTEMDAGETHRIRYVIAPHAEPVSVEDLRRIAESEGLSPG